MFHRCLSCHSTAVTDRWGQNRQFCGTKCENITSGIKQHSTKNIDKIVNNSRKRSEAHFRSFYHFMFCCVIGSCNGYSIKLASYSSLIGLPAITLSWQHPSYGACLEFKREYYQNCCMLGCVTQCSHVSSTLVSSSYRSSRLGLSHWEHTPYIEAVA